MEKFWQRCGKWVKKKHWLLLHFLVIWITQTFVKAPHMMVIKCSYTDVDYDGKVKRTILRVTAMMKIILKFGRTWRRDKRSGCSSTTSQTTLSIIIGQHHHHAHA